MCQCLCWATHKRIHCGLCHPVLLSLLREMYILSAPSSHLIFEVEVINRVPAYWELMRPGSGKQRWKAVAVTPPHPNLLPPRLAPTYMGVASSLFSDKETEALKTRDLLIHSSAIFKLKDIIQSNFIFPFQARATHWRLSEEPSLSLFFWWGEAAPVACRSSRARDQSHTTATTRGTAMTMPDS